MGKIEHSVAMYNHVTGKWEHIDGQLFDLPDEKLVQFVPQMGGAGMDTTLREMGWSKSDAMLRVLHASIGEEYEREGE